MAVITTSYTSNATLYSAFQLAPDLFDFETGPWSTAFNEFFEGDVIDGPLTGTPDTHEQGSISGAGTFDIHGTGFLPGGAAPKITQIVYVDNAPVGTLTINSAAGISVNVTTGAASGFITSITYYNDDDYDFEFEGSASLADNATTLVAKRAMVSIDDGVNPIMAEVRSTAGVTVNNETGDIISGTINGFTLNYGADSINVDGMSIAAATFMNEFGNLAAFEVMLGTLFGGADTFTANAAGAQTISGFGGNDTYNIGVDDFIVDSGGVDLAKVTLGNGETYSLLANAPTVDDLTLFDSEGTVTGIGNTLANRITGAVGAGSHNNLFGAELNDTITGGAGNDTLDGGTHNDSLSGLGGNDNLFGGEGSGTMPGGNDTLDGGAGDDTLSGGDGADSVKGGLGDDQFTVELTAAAALSDMLSDEGGDDTLHVVGGAGAKFSYTMTFIDILDAASMGGGITSSITGSAFDNSIRGGGSDDTLLGMAGFDTLSGGGGANHVLDGGLGDDSYIASDGNDTFVIAQVNDAISFASGEGIDLALISVAGSQYLDISDDLTLENVTFTGAVGVTITGSAISNTLTGGSGNDSIDGGAQNDSMAGGLGNDTFRVDHVLDAVSDTGGIDTVVVVGTSFTLGVGSTIENLSISGGVGTSGTGNALANVLGSETGDHTLFGAAGNDTYNIQFGDVADETIGAAGGIDLVNITLPLDGQSYQMDDGVENLTLFHDPEGTITAEGNALANSITGAANVGALNNLDGHGANDTLVGGADVDNLDGGEGNDSVSGGGGNDNLYGGVGVDTLGGGNDSLLGGDGNDSLFANDGNDSLSGGAGNDSLDGQGGNDSLVGGDNDDTLEAGSGTDMVQGGLGNDRYVVDLTTIAVAMLSDTITDTGGTDTLIVNGGGGVTSFTYTMTGIDHIDVSGVTPVNISITGNALANSMIGHNGNDTFKGEAGNDSLFGFNGTNSLDGGLGDDQYENDLGIDTFRISQAGDMIVDGINANQGTVTVVVTLAGNQYLDISDDPNLTNVTFEGATGVTITGNTGNNTLTGGSGNDSLFGQTGLDSMQGGLGNDTFQVNDANDSIGDTGGIDTVIADGISHTLGAGFENLIVGGGAGATSGTGTALANVLSSEEGLHTLTGGAGNDTYNIGPDADIVVEDSVAGSGTADLVNVTLLDTGSYTLADNVENLTLLLGALEGTITGNGNALANVIIGAANQVGALNNLDGLGGNDSLTGGTNNDTLAGGTGNDSLSGLGGNDVLYGGEGIDTMQGGLGNDTYGADLTAAAAALLADTIIDTGGVDLMYVSGAGATSFNHTMPGALDHIHVGDLGNAVNVSITGNALGNSMTGHDGNDTLKGEAGNDTLIGFHGNNSLDGGLGDDEYQNSYGNDTFRISQAGDSIINGSEGQDGVATVVVTLAGNQYLDISDDPNLDNVTFEGATGVVIIGNNNLDLGNVLTGGTGNDTVDANDGADTVNGGMGNDSLDGCDGIDSVEGGAGNDTIRVDNVADLLSDTAGIDTVVAEAISHTLGASFENMIMSGGGGTRGNGNALGNVLTSADGDHTLVGGLGNDTFHVQFGDVAEDSNLSMPGGGTDHVFATLDDDQTFTIGENVDNLTLLHGEASNITGIGNTIANKITGTNTHDSLSGLDGNDTLISWTGNVTIASGHDSLDGGTGNDSLDAGAGDDSLTGGDGADMLNGGLGNDTYNVALTNVAAAMLSDTITDSGGTDSLVVFNGGGAVTSFTYTLTAIEHVDVSNLTNAVDVKLTGNALGNNLMGHGGADSLVGLGGDDTLGSGGNDTVDGGDTLLGGDGNDSIDGSVGTAGSSMDGGAGNDYLISFANGGLDTLVGGLGNDTFHIDTADLVSDAGGIDTILISTGGPFSLAGLGSIENLTFNPGFGGKSGTGNALANIITGADGNDTLNGGGGGNDSLSGGGGNDSLSDHDGNDTLDGGAGADTMNGGDSEDTYIVDNAGDSVVGGGASDTVISSISFSLVSLGQFGNHNLTLAGEVGLIGTGSDGQNVLTSQSAENADTFTGGQGEDTYNVQAGDTADELVGVEGQSPNDLVNATLADGQSFTLDDGVENLTLLHGGEGTITGTGNALANIIIGADNADDSLYGLVGADTLSGGGGNDYLDGGSDADSLVGGLGNDTFKLELDGGTALIIDTFSDAGGVDTLVIVQGENGAFSHTLAAAFENIDLSGMSGGPSATVDGNASNNTIKGRLGFADTLSGFAGNDTIDGLGGTDFSSGGDGNDRVFFYGAGAVDGGAGIDTLVFAGVGNILLAGHTTFEHLTLFGSEAGTGTGTVTANVMGSESGAHSLDGGAGNDTYNVQGDDTIGDSGPGTDTMDLAIATLEGGQVFTLGAGVERLTLIAPEGGSTVTGNGNELANLITGSSEHDSMFGDALNDTISGGAGHDTLNGGTGNDNLSGGAGDDDYYVDSLTDVLVAEAVGGGTDEVFSSVNWTLAVGYERLTLIGGGNIKGTGTLNTDTIIGGFGNETIDGMAGNDSLDGAEGGDSIVGGAGNDTLEGGGTAGGDAGDTLDGGLGTDSYLTSNGGDTYIVDATDTFNVVGGVDNDIDTLRLTSNLSAYRNIDAHDYFEHLVFVGTGNVALTGNINANQLTGGAGADTLDGAEGGDLLTGGLGNDSLDGADDFGPFNDSLVGGMGNDTYRVDTFSDAITEDAAGGTDSVFFVGGGGNVYQLSANVENLELVNGGTQGRGNTGANSVKGAAGQETIGGGGGNDTLTGGLGADLFHFDTAPSAAGFARITDFVLNTDLIGLDEGSYDLLIDGGIFNGGGLIVINGAATAAVGPNAQVIYTVGGAGVAGKLYYDSNGNAAGGVTQIAEFSAGSKPALLEADDFVANFSFF